MNRKVKGLLALSPLAVFLGVYLVTSIVLGDFYRIPVASAFLIASIYAILITGCISSKDNRQSILKSLDIFSGGAGDSKVLLMIWIFILAGAFAQTAKDIGSIDATVNLTLRVIPGSMLFAGLFFIACFISMSVGTSVGTIVALAPIAAGISSQIESPLAFMTAIVVGGAFFGDNLSFISDTTIAATRALDCSMKDKFKANIFIVAPAVLIVLAIYMIQGHGLDVNVPSSEVEWLKIVPYMMVLILALAGMSVILILSLGIMVNFAIGLVTGTLSWSTWLASMGDGISGMGELIIVTLLAGGMMALIRHNGGLDFLVELISRRLGKIDAEAAHNGAAVTKGQKIGAEFSIAALVSLANLCTANNTIAILTSGGIAKDISDRFRLDKRRIASILDTFSCLIQGLIPYGAQLLMASGLTDTDAASIIRYLYYPFALGIVAVLSIALRYPRRYCR